MPKRKTINGNNRYMQPDEVKQAFEEYRKETKSKPYMIHDFIATGKVVEVHRKKEKPLLFEGFISFVNSRYGCLIDNYFDARFEKDTYKEVIKYIRNEIRADQLTGAMCGIYNSGISAKLNGLIEKVANDTTVTEIKVTRTDKRMK